MKRIYNVVIIDDDQVAIDNLAACLNDFPMIEIAGTARNANLGINPICCFSTWNCQT